MVIQKQTDSICNFLLLCIYGIAASPKAGGLKQTMPAASSIIDVCTFTPHTHTQKKIQHELNRNRHMQKNRSLTHAPQPTIIQIPFLPFCSIKWTTFSSYLTWLFGYFLKHWHCCVMETLQLYGKCLIPILVISCSQILLASFWLLIFPASPLILRVFPGMPT